MLDEVGGAAIDEARRKPIDQPDRPIRRPSNSAPASDVIAPPSNPPTTTRRSTGANANNSALHSGVIGGSMNQQKVVAAQPLSLIRPRCAISV
jgi:hypothetical protein